MGNLRIFIGIDLPQPITERLASRMAYMQEKLPYRKWTHPADLHLTLHFLGNTPTSRLQSVQDAMAKVATDFAPFGVSLAGLGSFGSSSAPRVIWLGLSESTDTHSLFRLHAALAAKLTAAGFQPDTRPYRPHLTLVRPDNAGYPVEGCHAAWAASAVADPDAAAPLSWTVDRITLFQTHLGRKPSYERRFECSLTPI